MKLSWPDEAMDLKKVAGRVAAGRTAGDDTQVLQDYTDFLDQHFEKKADEVAKALMDMASKEGGNDYKKAAGVIRRMLEPLGSFELMSKFQQSQSGK